MNNDPQYLNDKISIQGNILQKIHELRLKAPDYGTSVSSKPNATDGVNTSSNSEFSKSIRSFENTSEKAVNVWKINNFLSIIGESHNSKTEYFTKKNNIEHIKNYLEDKYKQNYVVFTFKRSKISKSFKRCLLFDEAKFSVNLAFEICQIAKFYLDNHKETVLLFEMRNGSENIILFFISCVLSYCKFFSSSEASFESLMSNNSLNFASKETILRYIRFFDQSFAAGMSKKVPQLILNQIIITSIPTILSGNNFNPTLTIKTKYSEKNFTKLDCYMDSDFLVISGLEFVVFEETIISLFFEQENKQYHVLDLRFNTLFYQQGLYRFGRFEIDSSLPQESIYRFYDENFYLDIVLIENNDVVMENPIVKSRNLQEVIRCITERFFSDYGLALSKILREKGYNKSFAAFCAQMHFSEDDSALLYRRLIESGHTTLAIKNPVVIPSIDPSCESSTGTESATEFHKYDKIDFSQFYSNQETLEIGDLDLVEDPTFPITNIANKKPKSSLLARRNSSKVEIDIKIEKSSGLYAKRPLHLSPVKSTSNTIFSYLKDIDLAIDFPQFEKFFCEFEEKPKAVLPAKNQFHAVLDSKRLFLSSLAIKSLELNRITPENLEDILNTNMQSLEYQDILNLLKALPENDKERDILNSTPIENLNSTERIILKYSRIPEIYSLLEILKFEKMFFEEISLIVKPIGILKTCCSKLLADKGLKIIFKLTLEIGNAINCRYGRHKRTFEGFKIENLNLLSSYYGNCNKVLADFLVSTAERNGVDFLELNKNLKEIHAIKNEDIMTSKAKINNLILSYRKALDVCDGLGQNHHEHFKKLLSYVYKRLSEVSEEYKECVRKCLEVKVFFGEDQTMPMVNIMNSLSSFLNKVSSRKMDEG